MEDIKCDDLHLLGELGPLVGCEGPGVQILQPDEAGHEGVGVSPPDQWEASIKSIDQWEASITW